MTFQMLDLLRGYFTSATLGTRAEQDLLSDLMAVIAHRLSFLVSSCILGNTCKILLISLDLFKSTDSFLDNNQKHNENTVING